LPVSPSEFLGYETCRALSVPGDRLGSAGKTTEEIVQMWNEAHPEDMILLDSEPEVQPFYTVPHNLLYFLLEFQPMNPYEKKS
jgi:hypothetical protein